MHLCPHTLPPRPQREEKEKGFAPGPRDPERIDRLNDASATPQRASQECSVHSAGDDTNSCPDTCTSIPDCNYAPEPSRPSVRGTLSRIMDQVRSLLPTSVVHTTHEDTAPLTALPQGKRALIPVHDFTHVHPPRRSTRICRIHDEQVTQCTTYYPDDVTITIDVSEDTTPPQSNYRTTPTAQQTPLHTVLPPLYDNVSVATYNIGGMDVTPDCFHQFMTGFNPLSHVLSLQAFRPSATSHVTDFQRLCRRWGYHLVSSTGRGVGGVAIVIHPSLCASLSVMKEYVHGHLILVDLPVNPDPLIGLVTFACYYGPHDKRTRATCIPHLHQIIRRGALVSGD